MKRGTTPQATDNHHETIKVGRPGLDPPAGFLRRAPDSNRIRWLSDMAVVGCLETPIPFRSRRPFADFAFLRGMRE
jgi:hypothetical protein